MANFFEVLEKINNTMDTIDRVTDYIPDQLVDRVFDRDEEKKEEVFVPAPAPVVEVNQPIVLEVPKPTPIETVEVKEVDSYSGKNYFSDSELACKGTGKLKFDDEFKTMLNKAREKAGNPWVVTSGYRSPEYNTRVGGVADSSHVKGLAVDISAPTGAKKFEVVMNAMYAGIQRIGVAKDFIHLDNDLDKAHPTIWLY